MYVLTGNIIMTQNKVKLLAVLKTMTRNKAVEAIETLELWIYAHTREIKLHNVILTFYTGY